MALQTIQGLFAVPVGQYVLDNELTTHERDFILEQTRRPNMGNTSSADNYILNNSIMSRLHQELETMVNDFFKQIFQPRTDCSLYITQSWANYTETNQYHHKHNHPNSIVSGVLYISVDNQQDRIKFFREETDRTFKVYTDNYNIYNSESWWFEVGNNQVFLFPSTLSHMVENTTSESTRVSVAFNTFLQGTVGDYNELTELKLR